MRLCNSGSFVPCKCTRCASSRLTRCFCSQPRCCIRRFSSTGGLEHTHTDLLNNLRVHRSRRSNIHNYKRCTSIAFSYIISRIYPKIPSNKRFTICFYRRCRSLVKGGINSIEEAGSKRRGTKLIIHIRDKLRYCF